MYIRKTNYHKFVGHKPKFKILKACTDASTQCSKDKHVNKRFHRLWECKSLSHGEGRSEMSSSSSSSVTD
jgi:hypothetical protein